MNKASKRIYKQKASSNQLLRTNNMGWNETKEGCLTRIVFFSCVKLTSTSESLSSGLPSVQSNSLRLIYEKSQFYKIWKIADSFSRRETTKKKQRRNRRMSNNNKNTYASLWMMPLFSGSNSLKAFMMTGSSSVPGFFWMYFFFFYKINLFIIHVLFLYAVYS